MWRGCRQASVLSLRDSSSCGPGGSAAGGHMTRPSAAPGASLGLPGASWALASVGGALLQQVVALRPRRGLEPYPTSRGGQAWGKHHTQTPHPPHPRPGEPLQELPMVLGTPASAVASCAQTPALSRCCPSASCTAGLAGWPGRSFVSGGDATEVQCTGAPTLIVEAQGGAEGAGPPSAAFGVKPSLIRKP